MFKTLFIPFRSNFTVVSLVLVFGLFGATVCAQETESGRPVLDFDGNKVFSKSELLELANTCLDRAVDATHPYETEQLDYCLQKVVSRMHERGYLQAQLGQTLYQQNESVLKATIPVQEGALYRVGEIKIENTQVLAPAQILAIIGLGPGDIADGDKIAAAMFERVKEAYGSLGYIQYTAEVTPTFHLKDGAEEGIADFVISIDEGKQFKIRSIKFNGGDKKTNDLLRRELMVREGEVYNSDLFAKSITRMNNTGLYDRIDIDRDVEYSAPEAAGPNHRAYVESAPIDLTIRLRKRVATVGSP
jgi:outer membrane protein insertion porin family